MTPRLLERYRSEIVPKLSQEFGFKNVHQVPRLEKVVLNMGVGQATQNTKLVEKAAEELAAITGPADRARAATIREATYVLPTAVSVPTTNSPAVAGGRGWRSALRGF